MRFVLMALFCLAAGPALADAAQDCQADDGTYVTGILLAAPSFVHGHQRDGVELSHTRLSLRADDGTLYDVRADNVFAAGYDQAGEAVPAPLSSLQPGDRLALCGNGYTTSQGGQGLDWVHNNCGDTPAPGKPNGWLKLLGADALPGPNLEDSTEYCRIF